MVFRLRKIKSDTLPGHSAIEENAKQNLRLFINSVPWSSRGKLEDKKTLWHECQRILQQVESRIESLPIIHVITVFEPVWQRYLAQMMQSLELQVWPNVTLTVLTYSEDQERHVKNMSQKIGFSRPLFFASGIAGLETNDLLRIYASKPEKESCFVALINMSDMVHPLAFYFLLGIKNENSSCNFLYPNVTKISKNAQILKTLCRKPQFDISTLLRRNFLGTFCLIKWELLRELTKNYQRQVPMGMQFMGWYPLFLNLALQKNFKPHHNPLFLYLERLSSWPYDFQKIRKSVYRTYMKYIQDVIQDNKGTHLPTMHFRVAFSRKKPYFHLENTPAAKIQLLVVIPPGQSSEDVEVSSRQVIKKVIAQNTGEIRISILLLNARMPELLFQENLSNKAKKSGMNLFFSHCITATELFCSDIEAAIEKHNISFDQIMFWNRDVTLRDRQTLDALSGELVLNPNLAGAGLRILSPGGLGFNGAILVKKNNKDKLVFKTRGMKANDYYRQERCIQFMSFSAAIFSKNFWHQIRRKRQDLLSFSGQVALALQAKQQGLKFFYFGSLHAKKTSPDPFALEDGTATVQIKNSISRRALEEISQHQYFIEDVN